MFDLPNYRRHKNRHITIIAGLTLSLLLHAILLNGLRSRLIFRENFAQQKNTVSSMVWLIPAKAIDAGPRVSAHIATSSAAAPLRPKIHARAPTQLFTFENASANAPVTAAQPDLQFAPETAPEAGPGVQPRFDIDAALKLARKLGAERPGREGTAFEQLQEKPLFRPAAQTRLGRDIASASRPDCKQMAAGSGLLALVIVPYAVITDKKNSGCKW